MRETILYFGSFNPVHNGHIALAQAVAERNPQTEIWFVLSAQNPFKEQNALWPEALRAHLLEKSLAAFPSFSLCRAELELPRPSYTINTLRYLQEKHPHTTFSILMGEDNLAGLHKWKDYAQVLALCRVWVYPRTQNKAPQSPTTRYEALRLFPKRISMLEDLPLLDISSSLVREKIKKKEDVSTLVPWQTEWLSDLESTGKPA